MRDKKIWIFNAGNAFDGNPKWLFMYIVNYRKDITPYWFWSPSPNGAKDR